jgi:hypothetical protein
MPPKYDAYIVYHEGEYLVRPAFVVATKGGKFTICNMTDMGDAEVTLPFKRVAGGKAHKQVTDIKNGKLSLDFDLGQQDGYFSYQVTVDGYAASGESDPVIIIDP